MKKSEFQQSLILAFDQSVDGMSFEERMELIEKCFSEYQKKNDKSVSGQITESRGATRICGLFCRAHPQLRTACGMPNCLEEGTAVLN